MRYPPALIFTPRASWVYRSVALLITIILIALCAVSTLASGSFPLKNILLMAIAVFAGCWLLADAFKSPRGSLHYSQGQWRWLDDSEEKAGTLSLHLDLQSYMLVSFTAASAHNKLFPKTTQWFHLEARHADHASPAAPQSMVGGWLALRRAIHSPMKPTDEAVAA